MVIRNLNHFVFVIQLSHLPNKQHTREGRDMDYTALQVMIARESYKHNGQWNMRGGRQTIAAEEGNMVGRRRQASQSEVAQPILLQQHKRWLVPVGGASHDEYAPLYWRLGGLV
jgi:hypothetical protein